MSEAISRELLGKIVDEVFDGAIEDASVIEDIYAAIKRHETQHKQSFFAAEGIPADIDQIATDIVRADYTAGDEDPAWIMYLAIAKAILAERDRHPPPPHHISVVDAKPIALISEATLNALMQDTGGTFRVSAPKWPSETETIRLYLAPAPAPAQDVMGTDKPVAWRCRHKNDGPHMWEYYPLSEPKLTASGNVVVQEMSVRQLIDVLNDDKHAGAQERPPEPHAPAEHVMPVVSVKTMRLGDGRADYFVSIKVGNREVTPHVFREEYKAAYHVALYSWLLNGTDKPDLMAFDEGDWPAQATETLADVEAEIASVVQSVNEWDDRTSPDDYPEHLLITSEELTLILRNFAAAISASEVEG